MAEKTVCELCGEPAEMDFNALVSLDGKAQVIRGDICFGCYGKFGSDMNIVMALLLKRVNKLRDEAEGE